MEFRILGPLEVRDRGHPLDIGGRKSRALLALLLLRANEVLSIDRLVDELWPNEPPQNAVKALQVHVSRLRKVLEGESRSTSRVLMTEGGGYAIRVEADELDLHRFQRLLEEGSDALARGDPERSSSALTEALQLWRGRPLADVPLDGGAKNEIDALDDLRLTALEQRVEADLAFGRHAELVSELTVLVRDQPLRERFRAQLMLALYRSGRQSEALAVYRETRRLLIEELGIEPSSDLQLLERAILRHDPELESPRTTRPRPRLERPTGDGRTIASLAARLRGRRGIALVAVLLAVAVALAALAAMDGEGDVARSGAGERRPAVAVPADSVAVIDPRTDRVVDAIPVGRSPGPITLGAGAAWVGNADDRTVSRIDPSTRKVVATIGVGIEPTDLAVADGAVWVAGGFDHTLLRIDVLDNVVRLRATIRPRLRPLPEGYERGTSAVAIGAGSVWLAHGEEVSRIDPQTAHVLATIPAGGAWAGSIAVGEGAVWVPESAVKKTRRRRADADDGISRIDPASNATTVTLPVVARPRDLAVGDGWIWAVVPTGDTLWQIDPRANRVARTLAAGTDPWRLAVGEGAVWIENDNDLTVTRIDTRSGRLASTIDVGRPLEDIAAGEGFVWVTAR